MDALTHLLISDHAPSLRRPRLLPRFIDSVSPTSPAILISGLFSHHTQHSPRHRTTPQHTRPFSTSSAEITHPIYLQKQQKKQKTTAAMNLQPPVHDRFIVPPGASVTQRDAVPTARKPSLVPGGQPHPVRNHVVAVGCSHYPC
jgi:hypothetical protein